MVERLSAGELCTRDVAFAERKMAVDDAARLMREEHVGSLVVVDETAAGRVPVGVLTDRDIVTSIIAKDLDPRSIRAEDAMSTELVTALETDSILDVLETMRRKGVRRAPVVDGKGVLVGVLAVDDMLEVIAAELQRVVQVIQGSRTREASERP
jgi:CBS domain-containing protein